jgi:hypothetical protein
MMIILDMPVATTTLVTTMVIMVVSDICIVVVGGMFVRQRVSARLLRSRWIRRALWPKGVCGYFGNSTGHVQETNGRVAESKRIAVGWLKMAVEASRAVVPRGYSVLAPYDAKKLVCGRSWCQCLDIGRFFAYLFGIMRFH